MPVKSKKQSPKKARQASPRKTKNRVGRITIRQRAGVSNTLAEMYPYDEGSGYQASDECAELLMQHVKRFLVDMTAMGGDSGDDERDWGTEVGFRDRLITLLSENKMTLPQAVAISRVLRDISKLPYSRYCS